MSEVKQIERAAWSAADKMMREHTDGGKPLDMSAHYALTCLALELSELVKDLETKTED